MKIAALSENPRLLNMLQLEILRSGNEVAPEAQAVLWLLDVDTPPKPFKKPPKNVSVIALGNAKKLPFADVLLPLPYDTAILQEWISAYRSETLCTAPTLRYVEGVLFVGQEKVPLSPAEERIYACLAAHQGEVVSEATLLAACNDSSATTNILQVHIYRLRRKIAAKTNVAPIGTVRGVGYYLK